MDTIIKEAIKRLFGDLIRKGVVIFSAWLVAKGAGALTDDTQKNLTEVAIGLLAFIGVTAYSYWRSRNKDRNIDFLATQVKAAGETPISIKGIEIKPSGIHAVPVKLEEIP